MKESNQLDAFVKRKLAQRDYPVPPGGWEAAEQLLDADAQRRGRRRRLLWFFVMGLCLLCTSLWGISTWWNGDRTQPSSEAASPSTLAQTFPIIEVMPCDADSLLTTADHTEQLQAVEQADALPNQLSREAVAAEIQSAAALSANAAATNRANGRKTRRGQARAGKLRSIFSSRGVVSPQSAAELSQEPIDPQGDGYAGLDAIYALSRRDVDLPTTLLYPHVEPIDQVEAEKKERRHTLQIEAGPSLSLGWNNRQEDQGLTYSPTLGIGITRSLRPNWRVQLGLRYLARGGLGSDSTYRSRDFGFGFRDTLTTISPERLHFVGIPLRVDTRLAGRHFVQMGVQPNFLINSSGRLDRRVETDQEEIPLEQQRTWGFRQGFRTWDVQLLLGYRYYIGRGLRVGVSGSYGLRDLTTQDFFTNVRDHRAWNVRLMLEYDITRF